VRLASWGGSVAAARGEARIGRVQPQPSPEQRDLDVEQPIELQQSLFGRRGLEELLAAGGIDAHDAAQQVCQDRRVVRKRDLPPARSTAMRRKRVIGLGRVVPSGFVGVSKWRLEVDLEADVELGPFLTLGRLHQIEVPQEPPADAADKGPRLDVVDDPLGDRPDLTDEVGLASTRSIRNRVVPTTTMS
jgi:hypothetical protein